MTITNSSSARRAGFKVNNAAILEAAAIDMAKIGTRTLYIPLPPGAFHLAGTNVDIAADGIFNTITLPDANVGNLYTSMRVPAEWQSAAVTLSIYWKTNAVSGNAKFYANLACHPGATGDTVADETLSVVTAAATVAGQINKSQVTFLAATFGASELIGLHIQRDGTDVADTIGADISFVGAVLEFTGRG